MLAKLQSDTLTTNKSLTNDQIQLFYSVHLIIGNILSVTTNPKSDKMYFEKVDVSEKEPRDIATGLRRHYKSENMMGLALVVNNLKTKKVMNTISHGMLLCAANSDKSEIELIRPGKEFMIGDRVILEGIQEVECAAEVDIEKVDKYLSNISVGNDMCILFCGIPLRTKSGKIYVSNASHNIIS